MDPVERLLRRSQRQKHPLVAAYEHAIAVSQEAEILRQFDELKTELGKGVHK